MKKKCILIGLVVFLSTISGLASSDAKDGHLFDVSGLQLAISPPESWSAVWMSGESQGTYFVEYLPEGSDVNSWRDGYILVQRISFIDKQETLNKIESAGFSLVDFAFNGFLYKAQKTCPGNYVKSYSKSETFNNIEYVLGAGYCDKYGPAAPFGESNVFAYVRRGDLLFNVKFAWRPHSKEDQVSNPHWPIPQERVDFVFNVLKSAFLCGDKDHEECPSLTDNN